MKRFIVIFFLIGFVKTFAVSKSLEEWLWENHCNITASIKQYDYDYYNRMININTASLGHDLRLGASVWNVIPQIVSVDKDKLDLEVVFKCVEGTISQSAVSLNVNCTDWAADNYVLMPAVAYNGNRFESRRLRYSPKLYEVQDISSSSPIIVSDVLRLNNRDGVSRIQDRSGAFATPSVAFHSSNNKRGMIMLTDYSNSLGDYCISIEENRLRNKAVISVTSPCVREERLYMNCDSQVQSWDKPQNFKAGDMVTIRMRLYGFVSVDITSLYDKYVQVRKDINHGTYRGAVSYSMCHDIQEKKFNEQNFVEDFGYYSVGMRENFLQDWQIGWTGGMISTYPLLFMGNEATRNNVIRNFDWLFPNGISPSGLFWDAGEKGNIWYGGDIRKPHTANWHLIRKTGDAVYYIIKQFLLMDAMNIDIKSSWIEGLKRVCDSLVKIWDNNKQFGQFVDSRNGEICVGGSTSGAIIPAALVLAGQYFNNDTYIRVAKESAEYYYTNFTLCGITCGGPGDALQNPDSESSYSLVESYMKLYEYTGDYKWVNYAEDAANQFASWVVTGDYNFPVNSLFGRAGIKSMGAVYANTQNKHGAPGICTASGIALLRLYRATGKEFYLELLKDIAHNITQYIPCCKNPIGKVKEGWVCERVNMTDWEGLDNIGEIVGLSTWAETSLMLTTVELPGVYIQSDKDKIISFDNIEVSRSGKSKYKFRNPFDYPVEFTVLVENDKQLNKPLGENVMYGEKVIELGAKQEKEVLL